MAVCGIDIQGSEAFFVSLNGKKSNHHVIASNFRKISLADHTSQDLVRSLFQTVEAHFRDAGIRQVGIRARQTKGNFAGSPLTFKIEGIIQMVDFPVTLIHPGTIQKTLRSHPFSEFPGEIYKYQREAYEIAYHLLEVD